MLAESRGAAAPRRIFLAPPRLARIRLLVGIGAAALCGCASVGYLTQAAHGEWQLLHQRQPIPRLIADPSTPPTLRARLQLVERARQFAVTDLSLPDNRSYRSYTDLRRPYVVWNVVAAPKFSVQPLRWCFPISGCVDYRGYFHERSARAFAARLAARGDDVRVGGVTAYSTLGHFADPVLSTMLRYGNLDLVGTIFHELAHQLYYVPGDSEFDESFAMTVETEGLSRWLAMLGRSGELENYSAEQRLQDAVDQVFAAARNELKRLYAMPLPAAQMLARKQAVLRAAGERVLSLEHQMHQRSGYDDWIASGLNNADLAATGTYSDCVPGFERLLRQNHDDLPLFYAAVRRIGRDPRARHALCHAGALSASAPATAAPVPAD